MKDIWVPLSGALAQQRKVEVIANNVANANTSGYKRDNVVFEEYLTAHHKGTDLDLPSKEWAPEDFYRSYGSENAHVRVAGTYTNFEGGQLKPTGTPLDLALNGPGFFEVLTRNGVRYTRNGSFSMSPNGQLVTSNGDLVLSKIILPETPNRDRFISELRELPRAKERGVTMPKGNMSINLQGGVFVNNQKVGDLSIVEFNDVNILKKEGNSYFVNADAANISSSTIKTSVHQGFIEQSNVNAVSEMSELIKAHRQFESIQNVLKAYDNIAGKSVNEISRF